MAINHTITKLYIKGIIWIIGVFFDNLKNTWQYIMDILDQTQQAKVAKDVIYQYVFLAQKIEYKYQNISVSLKRD